LRAVELESESRLVSSAHQESSLANRSGGLTPDPRKATNGFAPAAKLAHVENSKVARQNYTGEAGSEDDVTDALALSHRENGNALK
jgi:hypothetical protein